jgi:hypothetical protein
LRMRLGGLQRGFGHETGWAAERVRTFGREEAKLHLLYVPSAQRDWVKS